MISLLFLDVELLAIDLFLALDHAILAKLLQGSARDKQTCAVGGSVVLVSNWYAELCELCRSGLADDLVTSNGGVGDLADDLAVCEAHDQPILFVIVLVLVLTDHLAACLEISLALPSATLLNLIPLE